MRVRKEPSAIVYHISIADLVEAFDLEQPRLRTDGKRPMARLRVKSLNLIDGVDSLEITIYPIRELKP